MFIVRWVFVRVNGENYVAGPCTILEAIEEYQSHGLMVSEVLAIIPHS